MAAVTYRWRAYSHPQLGAIEIGGWNRSYAFRNPPPDRREAELARFPEWLLWQALITPCLEWRDLRIELLDSGSSIGTYKIRAVIENTGWLPTYVSRQAQKRKLVRGLIADLELPDAATLVSGKAREQGGELEGRSGQHSAQTFFSGSTATADRGVFEWVVRGPRGGSVTVMIAHERAGRLTRTIELS